MKAALFAAPFFGSVMALRKAPRTGLRRPLARDARINSNSKRPRPTPMFTAVTTGGETCAADAAATHPLPTNPMKGREER